MFRPINPLGNGRFGAFETNTLEANRDFLLGEWAKRCVKRNRVPCTRCNGYGRLREDQRVGCYECDGEGTHAA